MSDEQRCAFEAWASKNSVDPAVYLRTPTGEYADPGTQRDWQVWLAALARQSEELEEAKAWAAKVNDGECFGWEECEAAPCCPNCELAEAKREVEMLRALLTDLDNYCWLHPHIKQSQRTAIHNTIKQALTPPTTEKP